jgi:hypothetical protein
MRRFKCPRPGCARDVIDPSFIEERALVTATLKRKPLAVIREFSAICPDHGKVNVIDDDGHHVSSGDTVGYECKENEHWRVVAFAVMRISDNESANVQTAPLLKRASGAVLGSSVRARDR